MVSNLGVGIVIGLAIGLLFAEFVNTSWFRLCQKDNKEWGEFCKNLNEEWFERCNKTNAEWKSHCDKLIEELHKEKDNYGE